MTKAPAFNIEPFGERGALIRFNGSRDDVETGLYANTVADAFRVKTGVSDAVAGIDTVVLRWEAARFDFDAAKRLCADALKKTKPNAKPSKRIDIPVLYGGEAGPDFEEMCNRTGLTPDALVKAHSAQAYRVVTIGFAPGFAYLGPLDERLRVPRLDTPRPRIAAGSVGVAGGFTGVYSLPSPGGWRIIGRTPMKLFDKEAASPFVFEPGAEVRFKSISEKEFDTLNRNAT